MEYFGDLTQAISENWPIWVVTVTLIVAAVIDGFELKVPNWITFPMVISGWIYSAAFAWHHQMVWYEGLGWSLLGTLVGLALLMPAYAIGGMGAGDVKLLAGVGAWIHVTHTFNAFVVSVLIGAVLAVLMVVWRKAWTKHRDQFWPSSSRLSPFAIRNNCRPSRPTARARCYCCPTAFRSPLARSATSP